MSRTITDRVFQASGGSSRVVALVVVATVACAALVALLRGLWFDASGELRTTEALLLRFDRADDATKRGMVSELVSSERLALGSQIERVLSVMSEQLGGLLPGDERLTAAAQELVVDLGRHSIPACLGFVESPFASRRLAALECLRAGLITQHSGCFQHEPVIRTLIACASRSPLAHGTERANAFACLGQIGPVAVRAMLAEAGRSNLDVRDGMRYISSATLSDCHAELIDGLRSEVAAVRSASVVALRDHFAEAPDLIERLCVLSLDTDQFVREEAELVLARLKRSQVR